jgi:predicted branched-subunit amino acid permease
LRGVGDGLSMPFFMVLASMMGFGSLARDSGLSFGVSVVSTATVWGLPGQVAYAELFAVGAPVLAIMLASSMANLRFLPMSLSMLPLFQTEKKAWRLRYLLVALMSINTWALTLRHGPSMAPDQRLPYYLGLCGICLTGGLTGTALGYHLATSFPLYVTVSLIYLNPVYFVFLFSGVRHRNCILALMFGTVLGPLFHLISPEWGLPFCGVIAGSAGYWTDRRMKPTTGVPQ